MSDSNPTKDELAQQLADAQQENAALRTQLAGVGRVYAPAQTFQLSEGDRQEVETFGVVNIGGRRYTREEVLDKLAGTPQAGVEIDEPAAQLDQRAQTAGRRASAVEGVDFIYPSVAPGQIDPAVAGTPGINGPAADAVPAADDEPAPAI